jgi:hypothetical protein
VGSAGRPPRGVAGADHIGRPEASPEPITSAALVPISRPPRGVAGADHIGRPEGVASVDHIGRPEGVAGADHIGRPGADQPAAPRRRQCRSHRPPRTNSKIPTVHKKTEFPRPFSRYFIVLLILPNQ